MATIYRDETLVLSGELLALLESYLPPFPDQKAIRKLLPLVDVGHSRLSKPDFLHWVDFTLENPDQIWEIESPMGRKVYHYLSYIENREAVPAFVVEVASWDDFTELCDYSIIIRESDLEQVFDGCLIYCRSREWEKEQLVRVLNDSALSKYDEEHLDEARDLIDTAISLSGTPKAYLFNNRGLISWKMGHTDQAKEDFSRSIALDECNSDPYFNIGLIYFDESDYGQALNYLGRAVEISPKDSQFLTELGHLYLEMKREREALKLFDRAMENDPADAQVDFHLGYYYLYKKRRPKNAIKYYRKGLEKDSQDQFAMVDLAVAHWLAGHGRKTREIRRAVLAFPFLLPYTISRLVYLNLEMGEFDNALELYGQALRLEEPYEPGWLHYHAALVYARTDRPRKAMETLALAVRAGGKAILESAASEEALRDLKETSDFRRLKRLSSRSDSRCRRGCKP